jgi:hypothetical protein
MVTRVKGMPVQPYVVWWLDGAFDGCVVFGMGVIICNINSNNFLACENLGRNQCLVIARLRPAGRASSAERQQEAKRRGT